jgi:hypothetical protein
MQADKRKVLGEFVYPMLGLCACAVFVGTLFNVDWDNNRLLFQVAMQRCCVIAIALFGGYFLAAYLVNKIGATRFGQEDDLSAAFQLCGYALVVTFVVYFICGLFPDFSIVKIFKLYTIYIVWEALPFTTPRLPDNRRLLYTLFVTVLLIVCPELIEWIFNKLVQLFH